MKKILRKCIFFLILGFGVSSFLWAQEAIEVEAGVGTIRAALNLAAAGDTLLLVTPGSDSVYTDTARLDTKIDITIKAAPGLSDRPVINCSGSSFCRPSAGLNVYGIKFTNMGYTITVKAPVADEITSSDFSIRIDDCVFEDFGNGSVYYNSDGTKSPVDSVIITNSYIRNGADRYAIYAKTTKDKAYQPYKYLRIENVLIANVPHGGIIVAASYDSTIATPKVLIDHVTIDSCPGKGIKVTVPGAVVQNCIVTATDTAKAAFDVTASEKFTSTDPPALKNCIYNTGYLKVVSDFGTVTDTMNIDSADVQYVDAAGGNYTLADGSPGKGAATDGKDIGYLGSPTLPTKVPSVDFSGSVNVYPNPTTGQFHISLGEDFTGNASIEIYDVIGKVVTRMNNLNDRQEITLDISDSPAGIYFGRLKAENKTYLFKVLKK